MPGTGMIAVFVLSLYGAVPAGVGGGVLVAAGKGEAGKAGGGPGYILVNPGCFQMGSPDNEEGRWADEERHEVCISKAYYLKETEVTQGEWKELMGNNPALFGACGDQCPVERVSWFDAVAYANALSKKEGLEQCYALNGCTGTAGGGCSESDVFCGGDYKCNEVTFKGVACKGYRLPTEAEWEYAARAGSGEARYGSLGDVAWYGGNSGEKTRAVRQKAPNAWGAYDMLGNVWEWCGDWFDDYGTLRDDPQGAATGTKRVYRGGGWNFDPQYVRAADRDKDEPDYRTANVGFRLVRTK